MKDKIRKEALEWYSSIDRNDHQSVEQFVDQVMDKTTSVLFEEIKKHFKNEFSSGNLKHDFIISPEYYLELKLKEIKQNFEKGLLSQEDAPPTEEL